MIYVVNGISNVYGICVGLRVDSVSFMIMKIKLNNRYH